jgi:hypothetical protein
MHGDIEYFYTLDLSKLTIKVEKVFNELDDGFTPNTFETLEVIKEF